MYLDYAITHKAPMDDGYEPVEGVEVVRDEQLVESKKILREGQLFIQHGAKLFTVQGQELK